MKRTLVWIVDLVFCVPRLWAEEKRARIAAKLHRNWRIKR